MLPKSVRVGKITTANKKKIEISYQLARYVKKIRKAYISLCITGRLSGSAYCTRTKNEVKKHSFPTYGCSPRSFWGNLRFSPEAPAPSQPMFIQKFYSSTSYHFIFLVILGILIIWMCSESGL